MLKISEKMLTKKAINKLQGNKLKMALVRKVVEGEDESIRDFYFEWIKEELGITTNKLSMIINNSTEITLAEAFVASQILDIPIEDLIKY